MIHTNLYILLTYNYNVLKLTTKCSISQVNTVFIIHIMLKLECQYTSIFFLLQISSFKLSSTSGIFEPRALVFVWHIIHLSRWSCANICSIGIHAKMLLYVTNVLYDHDHFFHQFSGILTVFVDQSSIICVGGGGVYTGVILGPPTALFIQCQMIICNHNNRLIKLTVLRNNF